jgi:hypothetical protein
LVLWSLSSPSKRGSCRWEMLQLRIQPRDHPPTPP